MGADGMRGATDLVAAGSEVLIQDEASSTVWGMPGAVSKAGLASATLPLSGIAPAILERTALAPSRREVL
jgi:two-component system chemotaxis response regulator CheB